MDFELEENIEEKYAIYFDEMVKGKAYFIKEEFTEIHPEEHFSFKFEDIYTSIAKNGGLIALCKKPNTIVFGHSNPLQHNVIVMCQNGSNCNLIPYDEPHRKLILFGFNYQEILYGIHDDGSIVKFDYENKSIIDKISSDIFKQEKIDSAIFFEKGFIAQTIKNHIYYTKDIKNPFPYIYFPLYLIGISKSLKEFIFLPPSVTKSKKVELLFPNQLGNGIIHIIGKNENENYETNESGDFDEIKFIEKDVETQYNLNCGCEGDLKKDDLGKISALALSPKKTQIALYRNDGTVFIFHVSLDDDLENYPRITVKFKIKYEDEYEKKEQENLIRLNCSFQFLFCGEEAVCLCGGRYIFMINSNNNTLCYKITEKQFSEEDLQFKLMHCISEIDGLRVMNNHHIYFISKVSNELFYSCYGFSNHPAKKLINAFKLYLTKSPGSDVEIRSIYNQLSDAIKTLLNAASRIIYFDPQSENKKLQYFLIKSAQYGKYFVQNNNFNYDLFVQTCKDIRILNNINCCSKRDKPRFMTYKQYKTIKRDLIKLLLRQYNFGLAYDISKYLNYEFSYHIIYQKFAIAQIKKLGYSSTEEEQLYLYNKIKKQLKNIPNISYLELAKKAFKYGAQEIGSKFLKEEKSILTKIPQYIELKDFNTAISLAIDSYDRNIIYNVIDQIFKHNKSTDNKEFIQIISKFEEINLVVIDYLKAISDKYPQLLEDYLKEKDLYEDLFFIYLEKFFESKLLSERKNIIENKLKQYLNKIKSPEFDYSYYKDYLNSLEKSLSFKAKIIEKDFISKNDIGTFDNSIYDCYKILIKKEDNNFAQDENKKFKLSDKNYNLLRFRCYAEMNRFDAIDNVLEKNKNNLKKLNLLPYDLAELFYDFQDYDKATKYIKQIIEPEVFNYKIEMLKKMGKYEDAVEIIIADETCENKIELVNEILNKRPDLKPKCDVLFQKYKV